jgi:cell wall-associated NlpC family hydrolase
MPIGALLTTGAMVLVGNTPSATAADNQASGATLNDDPATGEIAATASVSDTESARQSRLVSAVVTEKLTSKVKATGRASARSTRTARATRTVKVTSYAATYDEAMAQAKNSARAAAHERAAQAAKAKAAAEATAHAKKVAKKAARHRADVSVRAKFGVAVLAKAKAQRGKPYRWGANGPSAFDCSGFVRYVMHGVGVNNLPRTSQAIAQKAHRIKKASKKRGDLIFFTSGSHVYHVAVYAGKGMIWHAPGTGRRVQKIKIWTSHYRVGRVAMA